MRKNTNKLPTRLYLIDIAKIIGIYLVVLCHMNLENRDFWHFVYAFHMPLFFLISGILYKDRTFQEIVTNNSKKLLIPYVTFYCISYLWWIYFVFIRNSSGDYPPISFYACIIKPFLGLFLGVLHNTSYSYSTNVALWFILSLFELKILLCVFNKIKSRWLKLALFVASLCFGYFLQINNILLFYSFNFTLLSVPYFFAGYYLKSTIIRAVNSNIPKNWLLVGGLTCMLITWYSNLIFTAENCSFSEMSLFLKNIAVAFIGISMILALSFYLASIIHQRKILKMIKYISDNTLSILGLHILFNGTLSGFVKIVLGIDTTRMPMFWGIGIACVSMTSSLCFGAILTRYIPRLVGK